MKVILGETMKILFFNLLLIMTSNLYASENLCESGIKKCHLQPEKLQKECINKLNDICKSEVQAKSPLDSCKDDIVNKCKGLKDDKILECLRKSKNKKCVAAVTLPKEVCPPNPCKLDYGKTDADKILECNMDYNIKHPGCSAPITRP